MGRSPGRRPRVATPATALTVGVLIVAMLAGVVVAGLAEHRGLQLSRLAEIALFLSFGLVGVIVAWHQPRNPMGWVLLGVTPVD
jgi:two-component system, NarL family, sensor kinase